MVTHFKFVRTRDFERVLKYTEEKQISTENDMLSHDLYVLSESDIASIIDFCLEHDIPYSISSMSEKNTAKWCSEGHWVTDGLKRIELPCHNGKICLSCARRHSSATGHFCVRKLKCCSLCHKNKAK